MQWNPVVITATFFGRPAKTTIHFLVTKPSLINLVNVFGLLVTVLTGLHCTGKQTVYVSCESILQWLPLKGQRK